PAELALAGALDRGGDAEFVQQMAETVHVREPRQIPERERLVGQQGAGHQGQGGILGARDRNGAGKNVAAADDDLVHGLPFIPSARLRKRLRARGKKARSLNGFLIWIRETAQESCLQTPPKSKCWG